MNIRHVLALFAVLALAVVLALTLRAVIDTQTIVSGEQALQIGRGGGQASQNAVTPSAPGLCSSQGAPVPTPTPEMTSLKPNDFLAIRQLAGTYTSVGRTVTMQITADGVITWASRIDPVGTRYTFTVAGDKLLVTQPSWVTQGNHAGPLRAAYRWALAGGSLTLSPLGDTCERRRHDLASVKWRRKTIWLV